MVPYYSIKYHPRCIASPFECYNITDFYSKFTCTLPQRPPAKHHSICCVSSLAVNVAEVVQVVRPQNRITLPRIICFSRSLGKGFNEKKERYKTECKHFKSRSRQVDVGSLGLLIIIFSDSKLLFCCRWSQTENASQPCVTPPNVIPTSRSLGESQDENLVRGKTKCRKLPVTVLEICCNEISLRSL